jgi:anti-sigma factor RsiW
VIGHLGTRVSALLDGQLSPADEERAWEHVHSCHQCRDAVEREGWVKTRLARMQLASSAAPSHLKGSLLVRGIVDWADLPDQAVLVDAGARRRHLGMSGIGSGAVGAAVMGVLALGASPANAPGAVVGPGSSPFGESLTHAVTAVVDRGGTTSGRGHDRRDAPPVSLGLGRTLAP